MSGIPDTRTLTGFSTLQLPLRWSDVIVIGSGVAGLRAALEAAETTTVILITKSKMMDSNTRYAQGGIAAAMEKTLSAIERHREDTIRCGAELCDAEIVDLVVREGVDRVEELMAWGTKFDRDSDGELRLGLEGGHSTPRVLHSDGDATGLEIARALVEKVRAHPRIKLLTRTFTIDLIAHEGECRGVVAWDDVRGKQVILSRATVLASGGAGRVYRETTNPSVATGDGVAMAYRAGAKLMDLEFYQFHPTTLYVAGAARALISEAVRGEGAHLVDRDGHRFMKGVHEDLELAPRDVVARAILAVMKARSETNVYLDMTPIRDKVSARFPGIQLMCQRYGLDLSKDRIPVRPSAHYWIGGVATDAMGATNVPRLFAAGEVACTGLHGANRLASNSLLEGLVFGQRAGLAARTIAEESIGEPSPLNLSVLSRGRRSHSDLDLDDLRHSLASIMVRNVGIERDARGLGDCIEQIEFWARYVLESELAGPRGWQTQNLLTVSWLIATQALAREESRGTHCRLDFPDTLPLGVHSEVSGLA